MLVELPVPGRAGEDVALLVGRRGELVEPLLRDVDLALGGAGVDLLEAVGLRLDEARVGERAEDGLAGQADHLAARAVRVDGEEAHDAVGDLGGGSGRGGGGRRERAEGPRDRAELQRAEGDRRSRARGGS